MERRLAAILAADVVGYSRLMEKDEAGTFERLRQLRGKLMEPAVARHRGRVFKLMGDGLLAEFSSTVDAVECAAAIQVGITEANRGLPEDRRIEFRIGVHVGDVIVEGEDRHGDAVNVAARLQELAEPGGICVSRRVMDLARQKVAFGFELRGEERLKNMSERVAMYSVRLDGEPTKQAPPLPDKPSIAVLPFENLSGDPEQDYFADGMVEEITMALSRMRWLFVIARNSSFTYKGRAVDVKQVGRELGVRYLIEGSVRRAGNRVRITSQLIDTTTGAHIWADHLDGTLDDIFSLQDRITASIVGAIEPKLRHAEIERAKSKPTESVDAYDLFLRAVALNTTRKKDDNKEALRLLHRAVEIDRHYGTAYALAGYCCLRQQTQGWVSISDPVIAEGIRMARLAAENAQDDPEALWMAGVTMSLLAGDTEEGLALIERSLALNPNSANGLMASGLVRAWAGDIDTALAHLELSGQLSPLDPIAYGTFLGFVAANFVSGRFEEASKWCDKALHAAPTYFPPALHIKTACCGLLGRFEEGRKCVERLLAIQPDGTVSSLRSWYQLFVRPDALEALVTGLRKAGLPE